MGLVYAEIELSNPAAGDLRPMIVRALVDSGSTWMIVPQHVANQLSLTVAGEVRQSQCLRRCDRDG
jgi:predicted aspartyl protease